KALAARRYLGFEDRRNAVPQPEIRGADNACSGAEISIPPARALCSDALHKLRLADYAEFLRTVRAVHRSAFDEYRLPHVVSLHIVHKVCQKITRRVAVGRVPEVVMRINDRKLRLDRRFLRQLKPLLIRGLGRRAALRRRNQRGGTLQKAAASKDSFLRLRHVLASCDCLHDRRQIQGQGRVNAIMFEPAATAMYCLLSNMYVMGDAFQS